MTYRPSIDFASVNQKAGDLRDLIGSDIGGSGTSDKYHCPFHDAGNERTPSLHVYEDHYHCFACGAHGDAVSWVARREGLSMGEAARAIDPSLTKRQDRPRRLVERPRVEPGAGPPSPVLEDARAVPEGPAPALPTDREARRTKADRPEIWRHPEYQSKLDALICGAEEILWSDAGRPALEWLRRRGLADETIYRFRLGFFPSPHVTRNPVPGLLDRRGRPAKLRAVRGVTIPWLAPGHWYNGRDDLEVGPDGGALPVPADGPRWVGCNVRQLAEDVSAPLPAGVDKCMAVRGSRRGYMYPWPDILPTQGTSPVLLVEGEFDALIGHQQTGHILHVATVGSASTSPRNLPAESRAALARCPWLLLAHDFDEAGAQAGRKWREAYPHKSRRVLLPAGKELNDFLASGGDLAAWLSQIRGGLERASTRATRSSPDGV